MQNQSVLAHNTTPAYWCSKVARPRNTAWSAKEKEKVRLLFAKKKRIKEIAFELNRSESAVNKFLSRSGIRQKTPVLKKSFNPNTIPCKNYKSVSERDSCAQLEIQNFEPVVSYLRAKGHVVFRNTKKNIFYFNADYTFDKEPLSEMQLLLLANKIRTEDGKPVFTGLDIL